MRSLKIFAIFAALNTAAWIIPQDAFAQQGGVSFGVFYNELSPYGQWVDYPSYGYVWIPSAGRDFSPYSTNGHWILTDYGWTWVSDYSWGWAPFHYGRWDYDDYYGWLWVPDNEWGPSWVNWRRADGYYGWAPMRPGISLSVSFGNGYTMPNDRWVFVRDRDFSRDDINQYYVNQSNNVTIIKNSTVIKRTFTDQNRHSTYVSGPDRADVQKMVGKTIQPVVIHDNDKPGQNLKNGQLQIYRPQIQKNNGNGQRPAPSRVVNLKDVKRPSERNSENPIPQVNPAKDDKQPKQPVPPSNVNPAKDNRLTAQPGRTSIVEPVKNNKQKVQPFRATNPPNKVQTPKLRDVKQSGDNGREQRSRTVKLPNKIQAPKPQNVKSSNNRVREKQPQHVASPIENRKAQSSQPKTNQDEKGNRKRD